MTQPAMPETRAELGVIIADAIRAAAPTAVPGIQCVAEMPHDTLVYQRGPNRYLCRCGKRYEKDGHGGLREEK